MGDRRIGATLGALALALSPLPATSGDATSLKAIMQGLRDDLVRISDGLLMDDFGLIALGAQGVAQHPAIAADQVALVAAELGAEMSAFKQMDTRVHELSLQIKAAAAAADRHAARENYLRMTEACLACHAAYKERVAGVLSASAEP